jgi:hypothetical protein
VILIITELYKISDLVDDFEILWYVIGIEQARTAIKMLRPRIKRFDDLQNDLRELKMKRWRQNTNNIEEREPAVKETYVGVLISLWLFLFPIFLFSTQTNNFSWMGYRG